MGRKKKEKNPEDRPRFYEITLEGGPRDGEIFEVVYLMGHLRFAIPEWMSYVRKPDDEFTYVYTGTEPVSYDPRTFWWGHTPKAKGSSS